MADIGIDPFGEHESRTEEPTDEHIPLPPVTPGRKMNLGTRKRQTGNIIQRKRVLEEESLKEPN